jgi:putative membrane-bound dehydrogenase-like protein
MRRRVRGVVRWSAALAAAALLALPALSPGKGKQVHGPAAADETIESFNVAPGLKASVWASEPGMVNPTNIDIDARGRVWVAEAANYRGVHPRAEGDRIMILEDTRHTGVADSYKVFVQDKAIVSPLGICVLGNKVIVAQSPNVLVYTIDESGDHPIGAPEVLYTGFGGVNHDHGVHAGIFGPDGRFYFNCGNEGDHTKLLSYGNAVQGKYQQPIVDITGTELGNDAKTFHGRPKQRGEGYREGLAFSSNLDGSEFQVLGYNFRNNYELTVDSFGTVWQSDNDDDGNQGVRINYVMEGGNFGFTGPNGSNWGRDKEQYKAAFPNLTKAEAHWHLRWPGIVPNLLNTGAGAPCGICVYEGDLLPEPYRGALLHCDAGPNIVRAYITRPGGGPGPADFMKPVSPDEAKAFKEQASPTAGAGYEAAAIELVKGNDNWFRPDDVCVGPDGAVYIADWYDPGVGGHATGDTGAKDNWHTLHGRIYRLAPDGYTPSAPPKLDLDSVAGQVAALNSPNLATRYLGYAKLAGAIDNDGVISALKQQFEKDENARHRARALWLLARSKDGKQFIGQGLKDKDADIRVAAFRAARRVKLDVTQFADEVLADQAPAMWRELCLALQFDQSEKVLPLLVKLADKYDGKDRWYLEAFGIACNGREKQVLAAWESGHQNKDPKNNEGIAWRLKLEPVQLGGPLSAGNISGSDIAIASWWGVGPFAHDNGEAALDTDFGIEHTPAVVDLHAAYQGVGGKKVTWEKVKMSDGPEAGQKSIDFVRFCADRGFRTDHVVGYFATAILSDKDQKTRLSLGSDDGCKVWLNGKHLLTQDTTRALKLGDELVDLDLKKGRNILLIKLRQGNGPSGIVAALPEQPKVTVTDDLTVAAAPTPAATGQAPRADVSKQAAVLTPSGLPEKELKSKDGQTLPSLYDLAKLTADAKAGAAVFKNVQGANCVKCHQVGDVGQMIGPPLNVVGVKLTKPQLYEAILYPSAQILMEYETWVVRTKSSDVWSGLKVEDTPDHITIKDTDAKYHDVPKDQIDKLVKQTISLMPEGLNEAMTKQDLVNLVEYLSSLKG